jgi:hypothetical protein
MKVAYALLLLLALEPALSFGAEPSLQPSVEITRDHSRHLYGIRASDAPLPSIALALSRATGCRIEVDERLPRGAFTLDLAPRSLDRLILVLARRANARVTMCYRLTPAPSGAAPRHGSSLLADGPVSLEIRKPVDLARALDQLGVRTEVAEGISGRVHVFAARTPLAKVLDQIGGQVGADWQTVVRFEARNPADAAAAEEERGRFFYADLARLSSQERREELAADMESLHALPPEQRAPEIQRLATQLTGMAMLVKQTPGEHREPVFARVQAIILDYRTVLVRLPADQQADVAPLYRALQELPRQLAQIH